MFRENERLADQQGLADLQGPADCYGPADRMQAACEYREITEFQVADWLYSLYRFRLDLEIKEWLAASRTDEERRIKGWLVHGFYQTRECHLIEYALTHRQEEPPHVAAL